MLKESFKMCLTNIIHNKMRSFLTVLGIVIGVMAVITLVTVMNNATGEVSSQFEVLGTGTISVTANGTVLKSGLNENDLQTLSELDNVSGVSPTISNTLDIVYDGEIQEDVMLSGKGAPYFARGLVTVEEGRPMLPVDIDNYSRICIIDTVLNDKYFKGTNGIGNEILIHGQAFTIVGILSEDADSDLMSQFSGSNDNGEVIIPYTSAMKLLGIKNINSLQVYVNDDYTSDVAENLEYALDKIFNYKDDSFSVTNMESLLDTMDTMLSLMTNLLVGIASIALLVGGIGIMNMMLVSVTERTNEIGLRKALGAKPSSIQMQFLFESIVLSVFGGIIGTLLGESIAYVLCMWMDIGFVVSISAIILGLGFSLIVGIIFGWAPAMKASQLNPIDALRSN